VIVTVDSDTVLHSPHAIAEIVRDFADERVGAVTGDVGVRNKRINLLTRLISYRYWTAFNQERAAQSLFSAVLCCSGPFSAYRRSVVERIKDPYVTQEFLGQRCTFGDDRHLTNLVLEQGYRVRFQERAKAITHVPKTLGAYLRQQVRWNKSFYREMIWTARRVRGQSAYVYIDLFAQAVLPFMLVFALAAMAYQALTVDVTHLWKYLAILVAIAMLRSIYGLLRTGSLGFLLFIGYGFMHVFLLIPTRLYALATMRSVHWGTRPASAAQPTEAAA
jgi:hyaluronan synthase/N-acetylglucosaminyltransferase